MLWSATFKKWRQDREEAANRCIYWQLFKKEEAEREGGGHQSMHWLPTLKRKEAREREERRPPIDALADN